MAAVETQPSGSVRGDSDFSRLWFARAVSDLGSAVGLVALPLVAVVTLKASTFQVSLLTALSAATAAALALPLGAFFEHRRKRPVLIGTDVIRALSLASVPAAAVFGSLTYPHLAIAGMVNAGLTILFGSASQVHLKALVPHLALAEANGKLESTFWLGYSAGPAIGGALAGWLGPARTLLVDAVSFLVSAFAVGRIKQPEPPPPATDHSVRRVERLLAGCRFLAHHKALRRCLLSYSLFGAMVMMISPLETLLLMRRLEATSWQYGLVVGLPCLAGVAGARAAAPLIRRIGVLPTLWWAAQLRGPWMILMPLASLPGIPRWAALVMVGLALGGMLAFTAPSNAALMTYRQTAIPDEVMTRAMSAWSLCTRIAQPIGALGAGILGTALGVVGGLWVSVAVLAVSALLLPRRGTEAADSPQIDNADSTENVAGPGQGR
ncbi:MFS transporter [Flindersiella endophytica]